VVCDSPPDICTFGFLYGLPGPGNQEKVTLLEPQFQKRAPDPADRETTFEQDRHHDMLDAVDHQ
jgi:hypothetical protein